MRLLSSDEQLRNRPLKRRTGDLVKICRNDVLSLRVQRQTTASCVFLRFFGLGDQDECTTIIVWHEPVGGQHTPRP